MCHTALAGRIDNRVSPYFKNGRNVRISRKDYEDRSLSDGTGDCSPWTGSALESASCPSSAEESSAAAVPAPGTVPAGSRDRCANELCSFDFQYTVPSVATHLSFISRSFLRCSWWPAAEFREDRKCCVPTTNRRPKVVTISPSRPTYSVYGPRRCEEFTCERNEFVNTVATSFTHTFNFLHDF